MSVWKWGCNFGGMRTPCHRDFLEVNEIVLGDIFRSYYEPGDLVAVTKGFTMFAIARISGPSIPITHRNAPTPLEVYGIAIADHIVVAPVQWKNITPYRLPIQIGHCEVNKREHVNAIIELWDQGP